MVRSLAQVRVSAASRARGGSDSADEEAAVSNSGSEVPEVHGAGAGHDDVAGHGTASPDTEMPDRALLSSIGDVVTLLSPEFPDVSPSSLRFLEREGFVRPRRTPGGHRLFGPEEIARIRRIKEWQRDRLSLAEIRDRLAQADRLPPPNVLVERFLDAALAGDTRGARAVIVDAFDAGVPLSRVHREVLRPALYRVGDRWEAGALAISQEHEITALVRDILGELAARLPGRGHASGASDTPTTHAGSGTGTSEGVVVAACVPGEPHDIGLRMLAAEYQEAGHDVHFLGANVPLEALQHALRQWRPGLLLLSVTQQQHVPALQTVLRAVLALPEAERPRVLVGGQASIRHADAIRAMGAEPLEQPPLQRP